jgi:ubiquitin-like-conjugating enzyme ATG10
MQESIDRETFRQNIREISEKSRKLGDNWSIKNDDEYLEKVEQKFIQNENDIYTFTYHVIFSDAFSVPVFYLNVAKSNGKALNYDELYSYYKLDLNLNDADFLILTQQEHPVLYKPFYFLHPCRTIEWMSSIRVQSDDIPSTKSTNYTLKWLSFILSTLNISFDLKYALGLNQIN